MSKNEQMCPSCGKSFGCGACLGEQQCWCMELPLLKNVDKSIEYCYCHDCLKAMLARQEQEVLKSGKETL